MMRDPLTEAEHSELARELSSIVLELLHARDRVWRAEGVSARVSRRAERAHRAADHLRMTMFDLADDALPGRGMWSAFYPTERSRHAAEGAVTLDEHRAFGEQLRAAHAFVVRTIVRVARAVGKTHCAVARARKLERCFVELRSDLEGVALRDFPSIDFRGLYFGQVVEEVA